MLDNPSVDGHLQQLGQCGFAWVREPLADVEQAFDAARALVDARRAMDGPATLSLIGDFVLAPPDGGESREFQTLHFDFGLPLDPKVAHDVARYTALHVARSFGRSSAATRLVPLGALLSQRRWPSPAETLERLIAYGRTHGAWNDDRGYVEGSLARVVEAAAGAPALPSVKVQRDFLCGMEFDTLDAETHFFERHSLALAEVEIEVPLLPGELLVFDNLAVAHGRRGARQPGELHQWVFGERNLGVARQRKLRDLVLAAFRAPPSADSTPAEASTSVR